MHHERAGLSKKQIKASEIKGVVVTSIVLCIMFVVIAWCKLQGNI